MATVRVGFGAGVSVMVPLEDELQRDAAEYVRFVNRHAMDECGGGGGSGGGLGLALRGVRRWARESQEIERRMRVVLLSACGEESEEVCGMADELAQAQIEVLSVKVGGASDSVSCLAGENAQCVVASVDGEWMHRVVEDCLVPRICWMGK